MTEHFTRKEAVAPIQEQIGTATSHLLADRAVDLLSAAVTAKLKEWEAQGAVAKAVVLTTGIGLQWIGEALPAGTKLYTHDLPAQPAVEQPTEPAPVSQFGSEEMQALILAKLAAPSTAGERAAFEAWLRSKWTPGYAFPKTNDGEYEHGEAQRFWGCWQAALLQSTALPDHSEQHLDMVATPKIGCVQHDCAECQARAALPVGELTPVPPNESGATQCIVRWQVETPKGWLGAYDKEAFSAYLAVARAQPVLEPLTADMFWNHDDAEQLYSSIEEFLNDEICNGTPLEVGHTRTIQRAVRLSNLEIRIISIDEESCDAEYEVVQAAHGITQGGKQV